MKTLRFPLLLALATVTLLSACDKDKDKEKVTPKIRPELLVGQDWKLTARTVSPALRLADGRIVTDIYAEMPSYDRDDLLHFEKPDVYTYDEGATKRDAAMPQRYTGSWSLSGEDKILRTSATGLGDSSYDVQEVSENTMRLSGVKTEGGTQYTYTFTFTRQ